MSASAGPILAGSCGRIPGALCLSRHFGTDGSLMSGSSLGGFCSGEGSHLSLLFDFLLAAIEEHVDHDGPRLVAGDAATKSQNFSCKHPVDETDGVLSLVTSWNGNVNELKEGVSITKGNDWDVDVGRLDNCLCVGVRIGDNDQAWLLEGTSDVIGE